MPNPSINRSNNAKYCPLAVDEDGNPLAIPPEATYWRVRRDTGGRPRHVNGPDLKPLTLPLEFPPEELLNLLGRGSYRLDLYDESGQLLETVALKLGAPEPELRNRAMADVEEHTPPITTLPATGSDVRLVLEANIKATQLAFQHNERTLTASLKIAETLRDGVHVLAESQADWIKSLAASRSFFRNGTPMLVAAEPSNDDDDPDDIDDEPDDPENDDDKDDANQSPPWVELLKPAVEKLADTANTLILAKAAQSGASSTPDSEQQAQSDSNGDENIADRGFEARELYDLNYASKKAAAKKAARAGDQEAVDADKRTRAALKARIMEDPALVQKLMQVNAQLQPAEAKRIMSMVENSPIDRQETFLSKLKSASVEVAVEWIRNLLEGTAPQREQEAPSNTPAA